MPSTRASRLLLGGLCVAMGGWVQAAAPSQACDPSRYALSSPNSRFEDHQDGTLTDQRSNLMWLHCLVGQKWLAGRCVGVPRLLTWFEAAAAAKDINAQGKYFFNDWRVPEIHEIATIAELQCRNPRINLSVFPDTPAAAFWSFTVRQAADPDSPAYTLSFGSDGVGDDAKSARHYVRLVRNGP